jgi:hypothetical protein
MGEDKEERWLKVSGILFIIVELSLKTISGIVEGVDFIHPEGFSIKSIESQGKPYDEAENKDHDLFLFRVIHKGLRRWQR